MHLARLVRTASPEANLLAGVSLALLIFKFLVLNRFAAPAVGLYDLGVLFEAILASVVASYIFYLLVIHVKDTSDKSAVRPYVVKHSQRIVDTCRQQLNSFASATGISLSLESVSLAEITQAFTKVSPSGEAPMIYFPNKTATWLEYLEYNMGRSRQSIARVLAQLPFLEAELVAQLASIDDCSHFEHLTLMGSSIPVRNLDLTAWAPSFHKYVQLCKALSRSIGHAVAEDAL